MPPAERSRGGAAPPGRAYARTMELHVPGGSSWFDALTRGDTAGATDLASGETALAEVTPAQLDEALAALVRGDIEYLALHHAGTFVQVAGTGSGPYEIEYNPGQVAEQVRVPGGIGDDAMRVALHGFLGLDPGWATPFSWQDAGLGDPKPAAGGGVLRKLFGRR